MNTPFSVSLLHAIPGRVRIKLSHAPLDEDRFKKALAEHEGIKEVTYTPIRKSLLITYGNGHLTTYELLLRTAIALLVEHKTRQVRVMASPRKETMTDGAVLAGILLAGATLVRTSLGKNKREALDTLTGTGVALAVVQHGWLEAKEQGYIHPELLSLGYLIAAFFNGKIYRGALVTWLASFGRHFLSGEKTCIEVRSLDSLESGEARQDRQTPKGYGVRTISQASQRTPLLNLLFNLFRMAGIAGLAGGHGRLLEELQSVSKAHGEVLEGMAEHPDGFPIFFNQ